jgi:hypothetical protein
MASGVFKPGNWFQNAKNVLGALQFKGINGQDLSTSYTTAGNDLSDSDLPDIFIELDGTSAAAAITNWTPTVGKQYVLWCSNSTNDPVVTLSTGITFDGTNDTATFGDANDTLIVYCVSATRLVIVENIGAVALS